MCILCVRVSSPAGDLPSSIIQTHALHAQIISITSHLVGLVAGRIRYLRRQHQQALDPFHPLNYTRTIERYIYIMKSGIDAPGQSEDYSHTGVLSWSDGELGYLCQRI